MSMPALRSGFWPCFWPAFRAALLAAVALPVALAASGVEAQVLEPLTGQNFVPPRQPMVYTRRLVRDLPDGAQIVVERSFAIRFARAGDGYRVDGEQIAVKVEMPEQLASLAALERQRVVQGLFPLTLDGSGRILSGPEADKAPGQSPEIEAALRDVSARIERLDASADERAAMRGFIAAIHDAGQHIVSVLPLDLFVPASPDRTDHREVTLPAGGAGAVTMQFNAERDPATGLMRSARREVHTMIGGENRRTVETFSLAPQASADAGKSTAVL